MSESEITEILASFKRIFVSIYAMQILQFALLLVILVILVVYFWGD